MKEIRVTCDRCRKPISQTDERIADFLEQEYPGQDICSDCDSLIQLGAEVGRRATLEQKPPIEVLESWCKLYDIQVRSKRAPQN